jgi:cytidylate kinase
MIITVSREFAAGGSEVARRVALALAWQLVDNDLIDRVAARAGLPREEVAQREERAPGFIERLARALATSAPELFPAAPDKPPEREEATLVRITETVVAEVAAQGNVVMVGRAAPAVLSSERDALHVKLVAPRAFRLRLAMERLGLDEKEAARTLQQTDASRARYHKQYYERDWADPTNYHMVLNTEALGFDGATEVIVGRAKLMWREGTRERRRGTGR